MPELRLTRTETQLHVHLNEQQAAVDWHSFMRFATLRDQISNDAAGYGRDLFALVFADPTLRQHLLALPTGTRLQLVSTDPLIAAVGWEYLRTPEDRLLAATLSLVRGLGEGESPTLPSPLAVWPTAPGGLAMVAVPVAPVDDPRPLQTEAEWKHLVDAVRQAEKRVTLTRVRPPTLSQLGRSLNPQSCTIVHFMGHSNSRDGRSLLVFEDDRGRSAPVQAADFADVLNAGVLLVVLNSCRSAEAAEWTEFGNVARGLVRRGLPYALGMQFVVPDAAATAVTRALYAYLLQGYPVEEAVRRLRGDLARDTTLPNPAWLAGIPALHTSLSESVPTIQLTTLLAAGTPQIYPDATKQQDLDLAALPAAVHFVGRSSDISQVLDALLPPRSHKLVAIHGLGGVGKTALARAVVERVGWRYQDRILAFSFETFARLVGDQLQIDSQFAARFYNRLARFYGLDPTDYPQPGELPQAILQQRSRHPALLVLDNLETLLDALERRAPEAKAIAAFLARLQEGEGAVLVTTRILAPADWGNYRTISLSGLDDQAGAALFWSLLPPSRRLDASLAERLQLNQRVQGHPVSIRLLAGQFGDNVGPLGAFLTTIEATLRAAEQRTPTSLVDPERQATLYACMAYSVDRLTPGQREALRRVSVFNAPFLPEFGALVVADSPMDGSAAEPVAAAEPSPQTAAERHLQELVRLGLLTVEEYAFPDRSLWLHELHAMVRWYIIYALPTLEERVHERHATAYASLAQTAYQAYDQEPAIRFLIRNGLADLEAALAHLPPRARSLMAYHLAQPYQRLGQMRRALELYEESLELDQAVGDVRGIAVTQGKMADVLSQMGKPQEAMQLYQESLRTIEQLGDVRGIAVTQGKMADVLRQMGKPQEAMQLYQESLRTKLQLGDVRGIAVTQGKMADVLRQMGKPQEAMQLYQESLRTIEQLGDVRSIAVTQSSMADVLSQMGKPQEAMQLYQESLRTIEQLGDVRSIAVTQANFGQFLLQTGAEARALTMLWQAYLTLAQAGYNADAQTMQELLIAVKAQTLGADRFDGLWQAVMVEPQPAWLAALQTAGASARPFRLPVEQEQALVANTVAVLTVATEKRQEWRAVLVQVRAQTQGAELADLAALNDALLALLDDQPADLPTDNAYYPLWQQILDGVAQGAALPTTENKDAATLMSVIQAYLAAADLMAKRTILAAEQTLLFSPQVAAIFTQNIAQARAAGEADWGDVLQQHLDLLLACRSQGIDAVFETLATAPPAEEAGGLELPFEPALIEQTIAALRGAPQERLAHLQTILPLAAATTDADGKAFWAAVQMALVGGDLREVGRNLTGIYAAVWSAIVAGVTSERPTGLLETIVHNTVAVLGAAALHRDEWRNNLLELRTQATEANERGFAELIESILRLLQADGNTSGLGIGLEGVFAEAWQSIKQKLQDRLS